MIIQQTSNKYGMSQELLFLSFLVNYGSVSIPYGNSARYDCILDLNGKMIKIQIKSVNKIDENTIVIPFANTRMSANGTVQKEYTSDEVDYIGIVYQEKIYLFSANLASKALTVKISKNDNFKSTSHLLQDYYIDNVLAVKIESWESQKIEARKIRQQEKESISNFKCPICGEKVSKDGLLCVRCSGINSRTVERPPREELKNLIRTTPFTTIGKMFNVTDNAIRKWCRAENLPTKKKEIDKISDKDWSEI